jgi:NADPH:quinone reductase-like Zn-dependent oxidoreductase
MKAVYISRFGGNEVLEYGDVPAPTAKPGRVLLRVRAAGVNPRDWMIRAGTYPFRRLLPPLPLILGSDVAGTVLETGTDARRFRYGDPVYGMQPTRSGFGAFAEQVCIPETALARIPEGLGFEAAAAIPVAGLTAWQALTRIGRLGPGDPTLILGASGGVGSFAVQIAVALNARVHAVCSGANLDMVRGLGAHRVLDYKTCSPKRWGGPFSLILDAVGRYGFGACREMLEPGGTYISTVPTPALGRAWLWGHTVGRIARRSPRAALVLVRSRGDDLGRLNALIESGKLLPQVEQTFPLRRAADALQRSRSLRVRGKLVIRVSDE